MKDYRRRSYLAALLALALSSCNGAGQAPSGVTPPVAAPMQMSPLTLAPITTYPGAINGTDNLFRPKDGNTPTGGHGATIDHKVPCLPTMGNAYHIHIFLGIVYHGQLAALPDAIGMVRPGPAVNGFVNTAQCFYEIHTHDSSGIVHMESTIPMATSAAYFKLKDVLDVWGMTHTATSFGPFQGRVRVYVGTVPLKQTVVSSYAPYTGKLGALALQSHEVVWIEIGKPYYNAAQLPPVTFYMEY